MGVLSNHPPKTPVIALVPPGPLVTKHTPILLVFLAYPSAAIAQACSWWLQIYFISFILDKNH
jgi:hypothetical protein